MSERVRQWPPGGSAGAHVVDGETCDFLLRLEVLKAQRLRYLLSVVCMDVSESQRERAHAETVVERAAPAIRSTDVMVMQTGSCVAFLLIDADSISLSGIVARVAVALSDIPWSAGGACYPETAGSAKELLNQANTMMASAKRSGDHRFHLAK